MPTEYEKLGIDPPQSFPHGTDDEIKRNMRPLLPTEWRQVGNQLIGQTEMGEVGLFIQTDYILEGTDEKGMPILKKV